MSSTGKYRIKISKYQKKEAESFGCLSPGHLHLCDLIKHFPNHSVTSHCLSPPTAYPQGPQSLSLIVAMIVFYYRQLLSIVGDCHRLSAFDSDCHPFLVIIIANFFAISFVISPVVFSVTSSLHRHSSSPS